MWKATSPLITSISLSYYSGSNWFLEEHSTYSKSAMYLNQQTLSNQGSMYDIKWMPTNWVGSHFLENVSIPYALIKEDALGRLEQLGDWMRFTTYREVDNKEAEWERIQQWAIDNSAIKASVHPDTSYEPCLINLSVGHSLISHRNYSKSTQNFHHSRHQQYQQNQKKRIVA